MSDALNNWTDQAIPAGSGRYYALLHSEESLQDRQRLISILISLFSKLGFQSREIEVAKHKLNWWRLELEKDTFQHPVMTSLEPLTDLQSKRIGVLLNAYGSLLESGSPSTDRENLQFHTDSGANACQLLCDTESDIEALNQVGTALSRLRCFRYLRQHVDHGLLCLPIEKLESAAISPAQLGPNNTEEQVWDFLHIEQTELLSELQNAINALSEEVSATDKLIKPRYKSVFIYAQLQRRLLESMLRDNTLVLNQLIRITPIKNYWFALRAAWAFDRL